MILNRILSNFIICLVLTVIIECTFAFILGFRKGYDQLIILLTNVFTNPILNIILTVVNFYLPRECYYYFLVPLEILVVVTEGIIYKTSLQKKLNPFLLSFVLNACSYLLGTVIIKYIF